MNEIVTSTAEEVTPARAAVFENQGIPEEEVVSQEVEAIYGQALALFADVAEPVGVLANITKPDFAVVYQGEGRNEPKTPVADIFPQADRLTLFAVTVGKRIVEEIAGRFRANDFALGSMLDSVASAAADKLAEVIEARYRTSLERIRRAGSNMAVLRYSPGYCGWHVSGQKKLFEFLRPEKIGITLRDSYLMDPLKSVSGVIIAGSREIHDFEDTYPFCSQCGDRGCRERIRALKVPL